MTENLHGIYHGWDINLPLPDERGEMLIDRVWNY